MSTFKVGQKWEIVNPESMGVQSVYSAGTVMTICDVYGEDFDGECNGVGTFGFVFDPGWVKEGHLQPFGQAGLYFVVDSGISFGPFNGEEAHQQVSDVLHNNTDVETSGEVYLVKAIRKFTLDIKEEEL